MRKFRPRSTTALLGAASYYILLNPVMAQTEASAPASQQADPAYDSDIIVTAQKREQRLSDVPVTVSASTGEQLQSAGVADVAQIGRVAPSFTVAASVYGYQVFSIRGVNFNTQQASAPPAVSVYVDEAPLPYSVMTGGLLLDVERLEVLQGAQRTLFSQNAAAGSINLITAKPTSTPRAGFRADVNHFGEVTTEGYVSGPLSDTLRARFAVSTTQFGAWQKGYYLTDNKNGDQNKAAARLILDWTPTERLKFVANLNGNYDKGEVIQPQLGEISPVVPSAAPPLLLSYPVATKNRQVEIDPGFNTRADKYMLQGTLRSEYELTDNATLTSLTSYAHFDQKKSPINYDAVALANSTANVTAKIKSFNQEIRLSGSFADDALNYVIGANYSHDKIREGQITEFPGYTALPSGTQYGIDYKLSAEAKAVFGNVDFKITPELTLSAGARYTSTKQTIDGCVFGNAIWNGIFAGAAQFLRDGAGLGPLPTGAFAPGTCSTINDNVPNVANPNPGGPALIPDFSAINTVDSQKQDNFSWRGSLSYKVTPDNMLYVTVSRGFKAGVFPATPNILNSQAAAVGQEKLTSYEGGAKLAFFDRSLRLNAAAFHYDYRDKQFYTYFPNFQIGGVSNFIINIPKSTVNGFDADLQFTPSQYLSVRAAVTYIDTKIKRLDRQVYTGQGVPYDPVGKNFNYAPPWSATFDAEYRMPVGAETEALVGAGGQWYAKSYSDLGEVEALSNPDYYTVDLRAGLQVPGKWRATVWVRNVTDQNWWSSIYRAGDMLSKYAGQPRTFGVSASFTF